MKTVTRLHPVSRVVMLLACVLALAAAGCAGTPVQTPSKTTQNGSSSGVGAAPVKSTGVILCTVEDVLVVLFVHRGERILIEIGRCRNGAPLPIGPKVPA
jgi:hypothetical protein